MTMGAAKPPESTPAKRTAPRKAAAKGREAPRTAAMVAKPGKPTVAEAAAEPRRNGLSPAHERFTAEYALDRNATRSYAAAYPGCSRRTAGINGWKLLKNAAIRKRVDAKNMEDLAKIDLSRQEMVGRLAAIVRADPAELDSIRYVACRSCWGNERPGKTREDCRTRISRYADPDPDCDVCEGEGEITRVIADTSKLSTTGRALFKGIKETASGLQVLMHDQLEAIDKLARIKGAFKADNEQHPPQLVDALRELILGIHAEGGSRLPIPKKVT